MDFLEIFKKISAIPRESGNEGAIRNFILDFASKYGLSSAKDSSGNVFVYAGASDGYEKKESICLQAHMDMVCVKVPESKHDFLKDPIKLIQDGDIIRADGTSLGADNGLGIAIILSLFTDSSYKHGPLEALFTYAEETGMNGAFSVENKYINSKYLINLDSEEEGVLYIGCAGGVDVKAEKQYECEEVNAKEWDAVQISVSGLLGGHSGQEINLQRLNAISVLIRLLYSLERAKLRFRISEFSGGTRKNVIPSSADAVILLPISDKRKCIDELDKEFKYIKEEYFISEPNISFVHKCSKCCDKMVFPSYSLSEKDSIQIVNTLLTIPHGVFTNSLSVKGVVETSDNLAILNIKNGLLSTDVSVRSLHDSAKQYLSSIIGCNFSNNGFKVSIYGDYPAWTPNLNSVLAKKAEEVWENMTGKKLVVTSIHAGLECGILNNALDLKDSISLGPDLKDVHSVNEHFSISSSKRIYEFMKKFLCQM